MAEPVPCPMLLPARPPATAPAPAPTPLRVPSSFTSRTLSTTPIRTVCSRRACSREYEPPPRPGAAQPVTTVATAIAAIAVFAYFMSVSPLPDSLTEARVVAFTEFIPRVAVVLPPAMRNFHRPQERCEPTGRRPVHACGKTIEKARPECIAAAGWIDDSLGLYARDLELPAFGIDQRSTGAQCDHERLRKFRQRFDCPTGAVLEELRFVVVHGH